MRYHSLIRQTLIRETWLINTWDMTRCTWRAMRSSKSIGLQTSSGLSPSLASSGFSPSLALLDIRISSVVSHSFTYRYANDCYLYPCVIAMCFSDVSRAYHLVLSTASVMYCLCYLYIESIGTTHNLLLLEQLDRHREMSGGITSIRGDTSRDLWCIMSVCPISCLSALFRLWDL